ncbi:hypothetical protein H0274_10215 [Altererythrobacter sp. CC-YST694]|uniref:hypothetical protein n=1 Tax=Altererythrobacter sp. CC-YST694 TaxID=2755038 RepID=UPI001D017871|nr:hypothetical protein [Altererythrobacter sp. CC-YST694]MCB5425632.1 hypothetical protein [Altererythrobacter sp. CC-YST694]
MDKALWDSSRQKTEAGKRLDWRRRMSDHVAYALLFYTGLQIFVTMSVLKHTTQSILPFFALIVLVAAVIPGCRLFEKRWEDLSDDAAADPSLRPLFQRDRLMVWIAALGLPFLVTGAVELTAQIL